MEGTHHLEPGLISLSPRQPAGPHLCFQALDYLFCHAQVSFPQLLSQTGGHKSRISVTRPISGCLQGGLLLRPPGESVPGLPQFLGATGPPWL